MAETRGVGDLYWFIWKGVRDVCNTLWPLRVCVTVALVAAAALILPDQARDAIGVIVEDAQRWYRLIVSIALTMLLSLSLHCWALVLMESLRPLPMTSTAAHRARVWGPRLIGSTPFAGLAVALFIVALKLGPADSLRPYLLAGAVAVLLIGWACLSFFVRNEARFAGSWSGSVAPVTRSEAIVSGYQKAVVYLVQTFCNVLHLPRVVRHHLLRLSQGARIVRDSLVWFRGTFWRLAGVCASPPAFIANLLATLFYASLLGFALAIWRPTYAIIFGPLGVILAAATMWIAFLGPFLLRAARLRLPLMVAIAASAGVISLFDLDDNHQIRTLPLVAPQQRTIAEDFERWISDRPDGPTWPADKPYPVFIVATEGGGIRNAYITAQVLCALQAQNPAFKDHLYLISGVSGGSIGAAAYAALIADDEDLRPGMSRPFGASLTEADDEVRGDDLEHAAITGRARRILNRDYLSPVLAKAALPDLAQRFWPFPINTLDRARALEARFENVLKANDGCGLGSLGFYALRERPASSAVPVLMLNTTDVDSGRRIVVSHVRLQGDHATPSVGPPSPGSPPPSGEDAAPGDRNVPPFQTLRDLETHDVPLSTAAFLSARFPLVTPVASVGSGSRKSRLADGGYFENSGTTTAMQALRELARHCTEHPPARSVEFHAIQIRYMEPAEPTPAFRGSFAEPWSPVRTLLMTRAARGELSRDSFREFLSDTGAPCRPGPIRFEVTSIDHRLPLGWAISRAARRSMDDQLGVFPPSHKGKRMLEIPPARSASHAASYARIWLRNRDAQRRVRRLLGETFDEAAREAEMLGLPTEPEPPRTDPNKTP